ncbi:motility associated factor glycosyltransferase family protein [Pseudomaricurvus alcaniphilus]|uniref:motility associated factor glycosyltransferase family protein n=1 Tax=Pseudomaricurvus alcaniphilus TaxID=1166482 RepID=UPI00140C5BFB|nr:6-hydroxymethylpterin diphosphokinase MptE-like protein [Pseudomaricurvus alcaniphilus]NHN39437.1 motility associated factor glycosyltransferase family protein [Pseudomaricurvus alcaniphilus]
MSTTELDALIRQAEIQKLQLQLSTQLQKNLQYFKTSVPAIYQRFEQYSPDTLRLGLDAHDNLNLINFKVGNTPVYREDPKQFALAQVRDYLAAPGFFKYKLATTEGQKTRFEGSRTEQSERYMQLLNAYEELDYPQHLTLQTPVGLMVMMGSGLGYHLEPLLQSLNIYTLYLYEANPDAFYASMHTVDWQQLVALIGRNGHGEIRFSIGMTPEYAAIDIKNLSQNIGSHKTIRPFYYTHIDSVKNRTLGNNTSDSLLFSTRANKAFTQEAGSLAASLSNYSAKQKVLCERKQKLTLPPALIIGNGPSLDAQLDLIKQHRDEVVLFSCGSALSALANSGIKPDFQVEIDHRQVIAELYPQYADDDFRRGITLLASNKVHPKTLQLFDQAYLAQNAGDIGHEVLKAMAADNEAKRIACANPTVTNGGLAFAINLGFEEIYLLGCDYGSIEADHTHAKSSLHYQLSADKGAKFYAMQDTVKGNFQDTVYTTPTFVLARDSAQTLLHTNPNVTCYNPNDGAFIDGALPIKVDDIRIKGMKDKHKILKKLIACNFRNLSAKALPKAALEQQIKQNTEQLLQAIKAVKTPTTQAEAMSALDDIYAQIRKLEHSNGIPYLLLRSITDTFMQATSLYATGAKTTEQIAHYYQLGVDTMIDVIETHILKANSGEILKLDDSHSFSTD